MKKIYLVAVLASVFSMMSVSGLSAQDRQNSVVKQKFTVPGDNQVFAGSSFLGSNSSDYDMIFAGAEYGRRIKRNLFWGVSYFHGFHLNLDDCNYDHRIYNDNYDYRTGCLSAKECVNDGTGKNVATVSGMIYYYFPVYRNILFLRGGLGIGLGRHYGAHKGYIVTWAKDKFLPYISAELQWVVRLNSGLEFKLSPLLASPSRIMLGLGDEYKGKSNSSYLLDAIHFSVGFNF